MSLTLNSTIGDLVLAIGEIIVESDGKTLQRYWRYPIKAFT